MSNKLSPPSNEQLPSSELKKIEQEIVQANPDIFKGVPEPRKKQILQLFAVKITSHSGPLPIPEDLSEYNNIIPNGADRIMAMAEKQQQHRIDLEKKVVGRQTFQSQLGQIFGLLIGLGAIGMGGYCTLQGHEIAGSILGTGGLTGLVSVFVLGKRAQKQSLERKNSQ